MSRKRRAFGSVNAVVTNWQRPRNGFDLELGLTTPLWCANLRARAAQSEDGMTDRMLATAWILLCLLAPARAHAQGFYYKEVVKDGRIYVFNDAANADRFA